MSRTELIQAKVREIIPYLVSVEGGSQHTKDLVVVVGNATVDSVQLAKMKALGYEIESINTQTEEMWIHGGRDAVPTGFGIVFSNRGYKPRD